MQAKDIPERPILEWMNNYSREWESGGRIYTSKRTTWFDGFENSVQNGMPENTPRKVALAKMRSLINRGLVDGCACGCRGDFVLTEKGIDYLEGRTTPEHANLADTITAPCAVCGKIVASRSISRLPVCATCGQKLMAALFDTTTKKGKNDG